MATGEDFWKGCLLTSLSGILWGVSTPYMKRHSERRIRGDGAGSSTTATSVWFTIRTLALDWKFVGFFLLNQLGSIMYTISLRYNRINVAVPLANGINLALVAIIGCYNKETMLPRTKETCIGLILLLIGISLCVLELPSSSSSSYGPLSSPRQTASHH